MFIVDSIISLLRSFLSRAVYLVPAVIIAMSVHEFFHAYSAHKLGDPTPEYEGRLTLNPFKHIDPIGLLSLALLGFGWGRAVRVNSMYLKNVKRDMAIISLAGPVSNFALGFISMFFAGFFLTFEAVFADYLVTFFVILSNLNFGLGLFNLIPIPPLDGSKIVAAFLPNKQRLAYLNLERYSYIFFLVIIVTDVTDYVLVPLLKIVNSFADSVFGQLGIMLGNLLG